jgi:hypothetical protein
MVPKVSALARDVRVALAMGMWEQQKIEGEGRGLLR